MTVYSIGHSSLPVEVFVSYLQRFGVALLVDVRRFPASRRHPQFHRQALESRLARESIEYLHLGESLGGFREGPYEDYTRTDAFQEGLALLERSLLRESAFMCAEKNPWECHRRFIAEELSRRGFVVRHIVDGQAMLGSLAP